MLVHANSLSATVDAVNQAIFDGERISAKDRKAVVDWIAARQGLDGAYADTFAGFASEQRGGIRLFSGERITSASARHILGQECCRVLRQLDAPSPAARAALTRADAGLMKCLVRAAGNPRYSNPGRYCCGKCTVGLWRHLAAGGLDRQEERIRKGVKHLRSARDGEGGWRAFPFWYTVLALAEIEYPEAVDEVRYASKKLTRAAASPRPPATEIARRRVAIARRALARA